MWSILISILVSIIKILFGAVVFIFLFFIGLKLRTEPFTRSCKCSTKLDGKIILITGGNSGIGMETAKDLAKRGARVVIASRDNEKSEKVAAKINEITGNNNVEYRHLDLANLNSVKEFADNFNKDFDRLDILINNAGCSFLKKGNTKEGIDKVMQINYVGPFLLTHLLLDKLKASKPSRIIIVSSYLHSFVTKFNPEEIATAISTSEFMRYSKSKLCDLLWTRELAKKLPAGVTVNAVHPGLVMTNIFDKLNPYMKYLLFAIIYLMFKTANEGAQTVIHVCASKDLDYTTGGYFRNCKRSKPSKYAEDDCLSKKTWDKTMELIRQYI